MTSPPIDIDGSLFDNAQFSPTLIPDSGYKDGTLTNVTATSSKNHSLLDSGITLAEDVPAISDLNDRSPVARVDVETRNELRKRFKKAKSIDGVNKQQVRKTSLQKSATIDTPDNVFLKPTRTGSRRFWENSLVLLESDSDSDDSFSLRSTLPPQSSYRSNTNVPIVATGYSKILVLGPKMSDKEENIEQTLTREVSTEKSQDRILPPSAIVPVQYANMTVMCAAAEKVTTNDARARSQSSSPRATKKKPKPLPRIQKRGDEGKGGLIASLPSNFKQHTDGKEVPVHSLSVLYYVFTTSLLLQTLHLNSRIFLYEPKVTLFAPCSIASLNKVVHNLAQRTLRYARL